jgi:hypothetical protein
MNRTHNLTVSAADTDGFTPVPPADTLRGAARYLELHGWVQNGYYWPDNTTAFPSACADGAIGMAAFGGITTCPSREGENPHFRDYNRAFHYFSDYLRSTGWKPSCDAWCGTGNDCLCDPDQAEIVFDWNDDDTRTVDEVLAALRAAADEYDWQHATEDDLETYAENELDYDRVPTRQGFLAWLAARR